MATAFIPPPVDLAPALSIITRAPRAALELLVEHAIERLDLLDGDTDLELNGDELDFNNAEDDFGVAASRMRGPGCPIADPDCAVDDTGCDDLHDDREPEEAPLVPVYGIDQTKTPSWGGRA